MVLSNCHEFRSNHHKNDAVFGCYWRHVVVVIGEGPRWMFWDRMVGILAAPPGLEMSDAASTRRATGWTQPRWSWGHASSSLSMSQPAQSQNPYDNHVHAHGRRWNHHQRLQHPPSMESCTFVCRDRGKLAMSAGRLSPGSSAVEDSGCTGGYMAVAVQISRRQRHKMWRIRRFRTVWRTLPTFCSSSCGHNEFDRALSLSALPRPQNLMGRRFMLDS